MEKYIALLRGINISGKNKIPMKDLKTNLKDINYKNVITYLNSGNIIFESEETNKNIIKEQIENMIKNKFNLNIPTYIIKSNELNDILEHQPEFWKKENKEIYHNIIFIIPPTTTKEVLDSLGKSKEEYEKIEIYKNIIYWSYDLNNYRKTNWWSKTASSNIKDDITIRTKNTILKVLEISNRG